MHGFYRIAAAVPVLKVADVEGNVAEIIELMGQAEAREAALVCFPELCLTASTCADLFHQPTLLEAALEGLAAVAAASASLEVAVIVGAPLLHCDRLYNCAVVLQGGKILGVVPKSFIPNYKEFYEKRWFTSGRELRGEELTLAGQTVPFGADLVFAHDRYVTLGVELCEDLWNVTPPSSSLALAGATILANLSASNEIVAKADYRRALVASQSARCVAAYVYSSCGVMESSTDLVFSGHALIAENGIVLAENERFERENRLLLAEVDCQRLALTRLSETSFADNPAPAVRRVELPLFRAPSQLERPIDPHPFVPSDPEQRDLRCREIFSIQAAGLAKRLSHTRSQRAVIGVSGGIDSTLALLVAAEATRLIGGDVGSISAITMPGFGTGERTYKNAVALCRQLGVELREIDITAACRQHFADIGHDPEQHDVAYENVQARERTQVLMDIANKEGGIVIGTGDLSEIALGWSTYCGDHMSMYAVNCSVPKSLIRFLVQWVAEHAAAAARETLRDILDTPITPELLPKGEAGEIPQKTEEVIGPYELHDFFLYHMIKYGAAPAKLAFLAAAAFADAYAPQEIQRWLTLFLKRFFANQFKRSCIPDGPKVGTISLSPRGDWRMPSDAAADLWLKEHDAASQ